MPIKARIDMLSTGIRTPIGVKVFGPDLEVIDRINDQLERSHSLADTPVVDLPTGSALVRTDAGWEIVGDAVQHGDLPA